MKKNNKGLSLIELIVVMAIITTLAGLMVPQFIKYIANKREQACTSNEETILNVYEKCVYGMNLQATNDSFQSLMNAVYGSQTDYDACNVPAMYKEEVRSHSTCPSGGRYNVSVTTLADGTPVAHITCSDGAHNTEQTVDFVGWGDLVKNEGEDNPFDVPTVMVTPIPTDTPTPTPTNTPTPTPEISDSYWPYADDSRWDTESTDGRNPNSTITIHGVPTGLFAGRTDEGGKKAYYCVIKVNDGSDGFKIHYKDAAGPQLHTYMSDNQFVVKYSGNTWTKETVSAIQDKDAQVSTPQYYITLGDIYRCENGNRYIYFHISDSLVAEQAPPENCTDAKWGNWYKMGEDILQ